MSHGREAGPGAGGRGWGRSLTTARPRAVAPSLAPRAGAGRGKRAGESKREGLQHARLLAPREALDRRCPPPLERGAPPLPVRLGGGGGAEVGIGGRASAHVLGRPLATWVPAKVRDWLRRPGQCSRVGLGTCLPGRGAGSGPLHPVVLPKLFTELALGPAGSRSEDLLKHLPPVKLEPKCHQQRQP